MHTLQASLNQTLLTLFRTIILATSFMFSELIHILSDHGLLLHLESWKGSLLSGTLNRFFLDTATPLQAFKQKWLPSIMRVFFFRELWIHIDSRAAIQALRSLKVCLKLVNNCMTWCSLAISSSYFHITFIWVSSYSRIVGNWKADELASMHWVRHPSPKSH